MRESGHRSSGIVALLVAALTLSAVAVGGCGSSTTTQTKSLLQQIQERGSLRFGFSFDGLPYTAKDTSGNPIGFTPDMANEMAKALKVKLEVVDTPGPDRIAFLKAGKVDLATGTPTTERALAIAFTHNKFAVDGTAGAVPKDGKIKSYADMKGVRITTVTGSTGDIASTRLFPDNQFIRVDSANTALQTLLSGQADILFYDISFVGNAVQQNPQLMALPAVTTEPESLMVPHGDPDWIMWLDLFLEDYFQWGVTTCGCGKASYQEWFGVEAPKFLADY